MKELRILEIDDSGDRGEALATAILELCASDNYTIEEVKKTEKKLAKVRKHKGWASDADLFMDDVKTAIKSATQSGIKKKIKKGLRFCIITTITVIAAGAWVGSAVALTYGEGKRPLMLAMWILSTLWIGLFCYANSPAYEKYRIPDDE